MNQEHLSKLGEGPDAWNSWRADNPDIIPDLVEAQLTTDCPGANLSKAKLTKAIISADFSRADFTDADLVEVTVHGEASLRAANFTRAKLSSANIRVSCEGARFEHADLASALLDHCTSLKGAIFTRADLSGAVLTSRDCREARFEHAKLHKTILNGANLTGAKFKKADCREASMVGCPLTEVDFTDADLRGTVLTNSTFENATLNKTKLDGVRFDRLHGAFWDASDRIKLSFVDRRINWDSLRFVGRLPLFGVSYVALIASVVVINTIGLLNSTELLSAIEYPVPIPKRMIGFLVASSMLAIGATIYEFFCPPRPRTFSVVEWVEQHGHPRLMFLQQSLKRPRARVLALIFTVSGGLLSAFLAIDRVIAAFKYVVAQL